VHCPAVLAIGIRPFCALGAGVCYQALGVSFLDLLGVQK